MRLFQASLSGEIDINSESYIRNTVNSNYNSFDSAPSINVNDYAGSTDSEKIANALIDAESIGQCNIELTHNTRTGIDVWLIDEPIELGNDTRLIVDAQKIKFNDSIWNQMIRQSGVVLNSTNPGAAAAAIPKRRNIHIVGINGGHIEGADVPFPKAGWLSSTIVFANTEIFSMRDIEIKDVIQFHVTISFQSTLGLFSNITLNSSTINTDGIHLSKSVSRIVIDTLYGETGDDTVAINAWMPNPTSNPLVDSQAYIEGNWHYPTQLWTAIGSDFSNVHHVYVRNILLTKSYRAIRMVLTNGISTNHIYYDNSLPVFQTNGTLVEGSQVGFGTTQSPDGYYHNIHWSNLYDNRHFPIKITDVITKDCSIKNTFSTNKLIEIKAGQINLITENIANGIIWLGVPETPELISVELE